MIFIKKYLIIKILVLLTLGIAIFTLTRKNDFSSHEIRYSSTLIKDYSGQRIGSNSYYFVSPSNTQEASNIISLAYKKNISLRFCGRNHSKNGFSLPRDKELLIKTENLDSLEFIDKNTIRVGPGPSINHLNDVLNEFGLQLPVVNGSDSEQEGPSIGGFISAGGLGINSDFEGGLWENIWEITLVIGEGKILKIKRGDSLYPWIFGSMGQLGLITEAVLRVIPFGASKKPPIGKVLKLKDFRHKRLKDSHSRPLYWLNFFGSRETIKRGRKSLEGLITEFNNYFEKDSFVITEKNIKFKDFSPPLLFHKKAPFSIQFLWGYLKPNYSPRDLNKLEQKAFLIGQKFGYRRYVQADYVNEPDFFKVNWGEDYFRFRLLKKKLDPKFLFNKGLFEGSP